MAGGDYVFRFVYPPVDSDPDPRAVEIKQVVQVNGTEELRDFYKFQHPNTRMSFCVTNYFRKNFETQVWESAGHIDWSSNTVGTIYFGVERTSISEVRKEKKKTSK
ncbi:hypothetical protein PHLCEN_2v10550 [Hermanssonia centrifuga]|uniref:Uncharacterized protein n=1 Tax=Hermanssonia centrifuga TaxID=98765 RepID=A0A2R6NMM8_9APHY|nr:hypothetical protein PHLCEN_2v10550 [Hermanssonia centrifuga]